jgi:hypothetical protein
VVQHITFQPAISENSNFLPSSPIFKLLLQGAYKSNGKLTNTSSINKRCINVKEEVICG